MGKYIFFINNNEEFLAHVLERVEHLSFVTFELYMFRMRNRDPAIVLFSSTK